jgi:DNA polymerase-3 subunit alpha
MTLGDPTGSIEVVVFPNVFEKYSDFFHSKAVMVVSGRVNGGKVLADKIMNPEDFKKEASSQMHVLLNSTIDFEQLVKLRDIFLKNKGKCNVFIHVPELEKYKKAIKASSFLLVDPREELISTLKKEKLVEKVWVN